MIISSEGAVQLWYFDQVNMVIVAHAYRNHVNFNRLVLSKTIQTIAESHNPLNTTNSCIRHSTIGKYTYVSQSGQK